MVEKAALVNFHLLCYTFFVAVCVLQGMKFFKGDRKSMKIEMKMEICDIVKQFCNEEPKSIEIIDTSRGDADFREVILAEGASGQKYVIKLADNDFTFPEKIEMWKRTVEAYRSLGYYCPRIFHDRTGQFPKISYKGHNCVAYREEYAPYRCVQERGPKMTYETTYLTDIWIMTAKIAGKYLDYGKYSSGYCLFDTFCPSDEVDEVLENALSWKEYAETLPEEFTEQVQQIWQLWMKNRRELEQIYHTLPTSVFQADLNPTNLLIDENGKFVGVYDFNLCGKDVFLNYLFREIYGEDFEPEISRIKEMLQVVSKYYIFSESEKKAALMLYRCIKPLWFTKLHKLKSLEGNTEAIKKHLDETQKGLTEEIDFSAYMSYTGN